MGLLLNLVESDVEKGDPRVFCSMERPRGQVKGGAVSVVDT